MRQALRTELKAIRLRHPPAARLAAAEAVAERILAHLPASGGYLAGYWAHAGELPLHRLQMRLPPEWIWCLPIALDRRRLAFCPWRSGDALGTNRYGIPEPDCAPESCLAPEDLHAVVLPMLGFSRDGMRLGMGGGFYDASFAFRRTERRPPLLIGAAYADQELAVLEAAEWDVRLDAVATEREWIDCREDEG